jgi:hypothetical protein
LAETFASSLELTIPSKPAAGQENGLLQAWEIFEQARAARSGFFAAAGFAGFT